MGFQNPPNKVSGQRPMAVKEGHELMLSAELENRIVKWIIHVAQIGYGQIRCNILDKVQELVKELQIPTPFSDGRPSHKWYQLFMQCHPNLHVKMANILS